MAEMLGEALKSRVSFAGLKDRSAVVVQYVSPTSVRSERPGLVERPNFRAELVGYIPRPVTRGMMLGNRFSVVLRDGDDGLGAAVEETRKFFDTRRLPNFFGYQRFGLRGMMTHRVGRAIVARDFQEAVRLMICEPRLKESDGTREARRLAADGRYAEAARSFSQRQDIERRVAGRLSERAEDFLGAIRRVPITIRRLFVNSYQSYLFNASLSRAVQRGEDLSKALMGDNWTGVKKDGLSATGIKGVKEVPAEGAVPLIQIVGYAYRDYRSRFDALTNEVLKEEGVSPREFYIKEAEEMSSEGTFRSAPLIGLDFRSEVGGSTANVGFTLAKGEYATVVFREILKPDDPLLAGF